MALVLTLAPGSDTTACNLFGPRCAYRVVMVKLLSHQVCTSLSVAPMPIIRSRVCRSIRQVVPAKFP